MDVKSRMLKSENVPLIIILKDQPSFKTLSKENAASELKNRASTSQQALANLLKEEKSRGKADKIKQFWIVNAIAVEASHPDIAGRVIKGYDFVNNDENPADDNGHGTHVAGTVGGNGNLGTTTGVTPNVSLFGAKVLDAGGSGSESNVIRGIEWSVSNGANVISMSLGGGLWTTSNCDAENSAMATAINNAVASNIVVVAATR